MTNGRESESGLGYWNEGRFYPYNPEPVPVSKPVPATNPEPKMTDTLEDPTMIAQLLGKIGDYLVERTALARKVAELESQVSNLQRDLANTVQVLDGERQGHAETERRLNEVCRQLDHERSVVSQLISERDTERDARIKAEDQIGSFRRDVEFWTSEAASNERKANEAAHAADVCREAREQMAGQVEALRNAFKGLAVIGT